jgi:vacuolar-type H+-ATPase subunit E/Vma4
VTSKAGISAIATEVFGDMQKEAQAIIQKAQEEATAKLQAAKTEADMNYQSTVDAAKGRADMEAKRIASVTDMEARNRVLAAKEELVNSAFQHAQEKIGEFVKTARYRQYLLDTITRASENLGAKKLTVKVNAADRTWLAKNNLKDLTSKLGVALELSEDALGCVGGCIVQTHDGSVSFDGTIDSRLRELKPALRAEAAKILFEEETN